MSLLKELTGISEGVPFSKQSFDLSHEKTRQAEETFDRLSNEFEKMINDAATQLGLTNRQVLDSIMNRLGLMQ